MTHRPTSPFVVLAAALDLPEGGDAPEWVHLLPTVKGEIATFDGRGPYRIEDAQAVIAASMTHERGVPIDENHATDLAAPLGGSAPARGWIKAMEARDDGIWGRVEWTSAGRALVADKAYRGLSPVMTLQQDRKTVRMIPRASLVNAPNLRGLVPLTLNQETPMNWANIAKALGLAEDASEEAILAAIGKLKQHPEPAALQSALTEIGTALGVAGADAAAIIAAAKGAAKPADLTALQAELTTVTSRLTALQAEGAKAKATAFVDAEIARGRVGVKPLRDHYIAMHSEDPARVEKEITALPILGSGGQTLAQPPAAGGEITTLNAEQRQVADQLGISHEKFLASLQADAKKEAN